MPTIFKRGFKASSRYDIARDLNGGKNFNLDQELQWIINRFETYYLKKEKLTKKGMKYMKSLVNSIKRFKKKIKINAEKIRENNIE